MRAACSFRFLPIPLACAVLAVLAACGDGPGDPGGSAIDRELRETLGRAGVEPLPPPAPQDPALVELGRALMFDKLLSGNRDISCATCHHPNTASGDALSVAIGTGGTGAGAGRAPGAGRTRVPRNSQPIFNLGHAEREGSGMFWDGRVARVGGALVTPAGGALPAGLSGALAAQAMFPVADRVEMRGEPGDVDRFGNPNELAELADDDFPGIWRAIMARLLAIPAYVDLFRAAYPGVPADAFGFEHAANAIAAFEVEAFPSAGSPFDRYLAGDDAALGVGAKRGAVLFYGKAGCAACHSGSLLTDHEFHNIGVPQIGPGSGPARPEDHGRAEVTGAAEDRYRFRTPALRNVELTGPWMHDGAYTTLHAAVRHYLNAPEALRSYDVSQLAPELRETYQNAEGTLAAMLANLDPQYASPLQLTAEEVDQVVEFLRALTDPAAAQLGHLVPASVPSGLPVGD